MIPIPESDSISETRKCIWRKSCISVWPLLRLVSQCGVGGPIAECPKGSAMYKDSPMGNDNAPANHDSQHASSTPHSARSRRNSAASSTDKTSQVPMIIDMFKGRSIGSTWYLGYCCTSSKSTDVPEQANKARLARFRAKRTAFIGTFRTFHFACAVTECRAYAASLQCF